MLWLALATKQVAYDRAGSSLTRSNGASDASPSEEFNGRRISAAVEHLGQPPLSAEHSHASNHLSGSASDGEVSEEGDARSSSVDSKEFSSQSSQSSGQEQASSSANESGQSPQSSQVSSSPEEASSSADGSEQPSRSSQTRSSKDEHDLPAEADTPVASRPRSAASPGIYSSLDRKYSPSEVAVLPGSDTSYLRDSEVEELSDSWRKAITNVLSAVNPQGTGFVFEQWDDEMADGAEIDEKDGEDEAVKESLWARAMRAVRNCKKVRRSLTMQRISEGEDISGLVSRSFSADRRRGSFAQLGRAMAFEETSSESEDLSDEDDWSEFADSTDLESIDELSKAALAHEVIELLISSVRKKEAPSWKTLGDMMEDFCGMLEYVASEEWPEDDALSEADKPRALWRKVSTAVEEGLFKGQALTATSSSWAILRQVLQSGRLKELAGEGENETAALKERASSILERLSIDPEEADEALKQDVACSGELLEVQTSARWGLVRRLFQEGALKEKAEQMPLEAGCSPRDLCGKLSRAVHSKTFKSGTTAAEQKAAAATFRFLELVRQLTTQKEVTSEGDQDGAKVKSSLALWSVLRENVLQKRFIELPTIEEQDEEKETAFNNRALQKWKDAVRKIAKNAIAPEDTSEMDPENTRTALERWQFVSQSLVAPLAKQAEDAARAARKAAYQKVKGELQLKALAVAKERRETEETAWGIVHLAYGFIREAVVRLAVRSIKERIPTPGAVEIVPQPSRPVTPQEEETPLERKYFGAPYELCRHHWKAVKKPKNGSVIKRRNWPERRNLEKLSLHVN